MGHLGYLRGTHLPVDVAVESALLAWVGAALFAAFGLFMGYLLPTDNAMQFIGPMLALFAFGGGLFMPIDSHSAFGHVAMFTPAWGIHQLVLTPFGAGDFSWAALANTVAWFAVFVGGAAWRMSRDTARV